MDWQGVCTQLLSSYSTHFSYTKNPIHKYFYFSWAKKNQFNNDVFSVFVFLHVETTNALYNINKMPNNPAFICKVLYTRGWNERRPDNINGNEYNRNKIEGDTLGRQKFFLCNQTLATANEDSEGVAEWICNAVENGIKWECIFYVRLEQRNRDGCILLISFSFYYIFHVYGNEE